MEKLLNDYFTYKLENYRVRLKDDRQALIAATYALDDIKTTIRQQLEIYKDTDVVLELLRQEVEDAKNALPKGE